MSLFKNVVTIERCNVDYHGAVRSAGTDRDAEAAVVNVRFPTSCCEARRPRELIPPCTSERLDAITLVAPPAWLLFVQSRQHKTVARPLIATFKRSSVVTSNVTTLNFEVSGRPQVSGVGRGSGRRMSAP